MRGTVNPLGVMPHGGSNPPLPINNLLKEIFMKKIIVDCERNDPVDIRCGGPQILGFDFFVKDENVDEMISFVKEQLKLNHLPLMAITTVSAPTEAKLWTKEMIAKCIKEGY